MRALAIAVAFAACSGSAGPPQPRPLPQPDKAPPLRGAPRSDRLASYRIHARLDPTTHRITATETLTWKNGGQSPVTDLPFHLYLNAFKNESSLFMQESNGEMRGAKASATGWGWIDVASIKIGGTELRPKATFPGPGADQTVMDVPLPAPVGPGETVTVELAFEDQLPEVFARTGYEGTFHMVGQWFPKVGVRTGTPGAEVWTCDPFHAFSEFFADFGVYDVELVVPDSMQVAATGVLVGAKDGADHLRTLSYHAEDVHDFAWMADPEMEVMSGTAKVDGGDVLVRVYYRPAQEEFAKRHLFAGIAAIEQFSAMYLPYPWPIMSIVDPPPEAADGAGGMEYPTLVTTAGDHALSRPGIHVPEYVTIHEVGHSWFQGMLASNEGQEAWLDEGVNEYADSIVLARIWGERASLVDWMGWTAEDTHALRAVSPSLSKIPTPIATVSWQFVDFSAYGSATYLKTSAALRTLESVVGTDAFRGAMQRYVHDFAFKHPTGRDFFDSLHASLGQDLAWFVGPAFYGVGASELAVRTAACVPKHEPRGVFGDGPQRKTVTDASAPDVDAWVCDVVVTDTGTIPVPVDVELRFADGTTDTKRWDHRDAGHWTRFRFERSSPLTEVVVDPHGVVLVDDDPVDDDVRIEPDESASLRAGARAAYWTETGMQVLGL